MPRRHGRRGNNQYAASLVGVLNSNSESDVEARTNILKVYIPFLLFIFCIDIGTSLCIVYIHCSDIDNDGTSSSDGDGSSDGSSDGDYDSMSLNECVLKQLQTGFRNNNNNNSNSNGNESLGDLLWLALIRCVITTLLLWIGVTFGKITKPSSENSSDSSSDSGGTSTDNTSTNDNSNHVSDTNGDSNDTDTSNNANIMTIGESALTTPLLQIEQSVPSVNEDTNNGNGNGNICDNQVANQETYTDNPLDPQHDDTHDHESNINSNNNNKCSKYCSCFKSSSSNNKEKKHKVPYHETIKNTTLILLFLSSTFFQVYNGIKVSTFDSTSINNNNNNNNNDSHDSNDNINDDQQHSTYNINPALPPLMCLSILWINIISYCFRVLLDELTREDALYLPPTVHRHPVFYEESRGINLHWCDICRTRITGACYRCSLCDFDICISCAKRNDASTVGEDLLRGDSGVRTEVVLNNTSYLTRSWVFIKPQSFLLCMSLVLLTCSSVSRLALPHFQGKIIDMVIPDVNGESDHEGFVFYIKVYVVVMVVQGAVTTMYQAIFTLVSRRLKFTIRNSLFESILSQDVAYFDGTESGRLISRLTNDLDLMMSPIQTSLSALLRNILILFGGLIMCFIKSYRLSMLAFVTIGPITYLWNLYAQWSKGLAREMIAFWAEGNSIASQALSHIRTIKAFGCEGTVIEKYTEANKQALDRGVKDAWGNGITSALTGYLDLGTGVLILYFGGLLVFDGVMTVGDLVTFQLFWNMMNNAYQNLQGLITSFTRSAAGAEKIFSLYDSKPDIDPSKGSDVSWDVKGHIELRNVKFFYQMRPDNIVLEKFNLQIPAGKTVALVGKSGGGKSTIINLLLRFYDAKEGSLILDGRTYPSLKVPQLRSLFGVVTQETELFSLTVEQNIAYGLKDDEYTMDDLISAAKKAQAYEFIIDMKDGFKTRIGERGNRLSGGQKQRIAIARVFLRKPKIILLDEATSALDENSQEAVQKALNTLITESKATVVIVAHRLSTVMNADSIVVIEQGVALEQGTHQELVDKCGVYASMVQKQSQMKKNELKQDTKEMKEGGVWL